MGADGKITIWKVAAAQEAFPEDWSTLINLLPMVYRNKLDDVEVFHSYEGDNSWSSWEDLEDWYTYEGAPSVERCREFHKWLSANVSGDWEVWT